jgi:hypothetical protein
VGKDKPSWLARLASLKGMGTDQKEAILAFPAFPVKRLRKKGRQLRSDKRLRLPLRLALVLVVIPHGQLALATGLLRVPGGRAGKLAAAVFVARTRDFLTIRIFTSKAGFMVC